MCTSRDARPVMGICQEKRYLVEFEKDLDVGFVESSEILDIILGLDHHNVDVAARTHVVENTSPARSQVKSDFQRKR